MISSPQQLVLRPRRPHLLLALAVVVFSSAALGWHLTDLLSEGTVAQSFMSPGLWQKSVESLGGKITWRGENGFAELDPIPLVISATGFGLVLWLACGKLVQSLRREPLTCHLSDLGIRAWTWWVVPWGYPFLQFCAEFLPSECQVFLRGSLPFWSAVMIGGWSATCVALATRVDENPKPAPSISSPSEPSLRQIPIIVWLAIVGFTLSFGWQNQKLYESLLLPHGDSAMYEEHLWNLLHGKGFRSYLDNGRLFLGEHTQIVHIFLIPIYLLHPSHVTLEWAQSLCLALGAIPVYQMAFQAGGNKTTAICLSVTYLLAFPVQFLDIAIDFKTFRPNSFEIPILLCAINSLERRRLLAVAFWIVLALTCQEDVAPVLAPWGLWIALRGPAAIGCGDSRLRRPLRIGGCLLCIGSVAWVALVVKVILPWFRDGADVHFAQYFSEIGDSTDSITAALIKNPLAVWNRLGRAESWLFATALLIPFGGLSLLSPGRLAIAAPLFCVLCLSDITDSPLHHFHAPMIPFIVWAACHGAPRGARWLARIAGRDHGASIPERGDSSVNDTVARYLPTIGSWCVTTAFVCGFWVGLSPLSMAFWDPFSKGFWRTLYVPGVRAEQIENVLASIPQTARVASTDLIHPRFTHYERSYDYSSYRPIVPDDCEYIVIDRNAPGNTIRTPADIKELRLPNSPWILLSDVSAGQFFVLKRREMAQE